MPQSESTGALYVAKVQAILPSRRDIYDALSTHRAYMRADAAAAYIGLSEDDTAPDAIRPTFLTTDNVPIEHGGLDLYVTAIDEQQQLAVIQAYLGDGGNETFSGLFLRGAERNDFDGSFGHHTAAENEAAIYVVPLQGCESRTPVRAAAILALGSEAIDASEDAPTARQAQAYYLAARLLLGSAPEITARQ